MGSKWIIASGPDVGPGTAFGFHDGVASGVVCSLGPGAETQLKSGCRVSWSPTLFLRSADLGLCSSDSSILVGSEVPRA